MCDYKLRPSDVPLMAPIQNVEKHWCKRTSPWGEGKAAMFLERWSSPTANHLLGYYYKCLRKILRATAGSSSSHLISCAHKSIGCPWGASVLQGTSSFSLITLLLLLLPWSHQILVIRDYCVCGEGHGGGTRAHSYAFLHVLPENF